MNRRYIMELARKGFTFFGKSGHFELMCRGKTDVDCIIYDASKDIFSVTSVEGLPAINSIRELYRCGKKYKGFDALWRAM